MTVLASSNATADAVAAVIDSLVALVLGLLSFVSASRTVRRAPARQARRDRAAAAAEPEREVVTLPPGPALADPSDVPALSWPGIYAQVTGLYERLLAYVEQETARLRARVAELETPTEEGPRMPVPRPPKHGKAAAEEAPPDPLDNAPDVEPTEPGVREGLETDIPAGGETPEDHPSDWPEGS